MSNNKNKVIRDEDFGRKFHSDPVEPSWVEVKPDEIEAEEMPPFVQPPKQAAIDPQYLADHMAKHGNYLYHSTSFDNLGDVSVNGLRPRQEHGTGNFNNSYLEPRGTHVYLGSKNYLNSATSFYGPMLRINLGKLNPKNISADEENLRANGVEIQRVHLDELPDDYEPERTSFYMTRHEIPDSVPYGAINKTLAESVARKIGIKKVTNPFDHKNQGEWAEANAKLVDHPEATKASLESFGTVTHKGRVPPEAIEINPEYFPYLVKMADHHHRIGYGYASHFYPFNHDASWNDFGFHPYSNTYDDGYDPNERGDEYTWITKMKDQKRPWESLLEFLTQWAEREKVPYDHFDDLIEKYSDAIGADTNDIREYLLGRQNDLDEEQSDYHHNLLVDENDYHHNLLVDENPEPVKLPQQNDENQMRLFSSRTVESAWPDVMAKATRLIQEGNVSLIRNSNNVIVSRVVGDHGTYQCEIAREDPNSQVITQWTCDCPWSDFAWLRTRQWMKYEGRVCSHVLATFWQAKKTPLDPDEEEEQEQTQQEQPTEGFGQAPGVSTPNDKDKPFGDVVRTPVQKTPKGVPNAAPMGFGIPGAFSSVKMSSIEIRVESGVKTETMLALEQMVREGVVPIVQFLEEVEAEYRTGKAPVPGAAPMGHNHDGFPFYHWSDLGYDEESGEQASPPQSGPEWRGQQGIIHKGTRGEVVDIEPIMNWIKVIVPTAPSFKHLHPKQLETDYIDADSVKLLNYDFKAKQPIKTFRTPFIGGR